jgi:flavin-binding protein dodecin
MADHTYRVTEIVGSSPDGVEAAIRNGMQRASRTLRNMDWLEVTQIRGHVVGGDVADWQVGMKIGFRLDDSAD